MWSLLRSLLWFLTRARWKQKSLQWPRSSCSPSLTALTPPPVQSVPMWPFLLFSGNASAFLPQGIYPCSFLCLEHFSPRNLLALSNLDLGDLPWSPWIASSLSHTAFPITLCLIFLQSAYSLSIICYKLPIYLIYYLSFPSMCKLWKIRQFCSLFHLLCLEQCHRDIKYSGTLI